MKNKIMIIDTGSSVKSIIDNVMDDSNENESESKKVDSIEGTGNDVCMFIGEIDTPDDYMLLKNFIKDGAHETHMLMPLFVYSVADNIELIKNENIPENSAWMPNPFKIQDLIESMKSYIAISKLF